MWYLRVDTLGIMLAFSVLFVLASVAVQKRKPGKRLTPFLLVFDLALIAYVSEKLALFYLAYTLVTFLLVAVLQRAQVHRRPLFVIFCLLAVSPFFYVRFADMLPGLPIYITLIGFAYNMLKAVDALFFVYYTKRAIPALTYANFLLFFPVITAGPIFRYRDFSKYYETPKLPTLSTCEVCLKRLILGLFKKMVIVMWVQQCLNHVLAMESHVLVSCMLVALSYALLYFDLSGYSDIAIAVGTFVGIPVPENFKSPLTAASFTQFWRKWHVTLSDWIREHIFVVVSGKRLNKWISALIGICTMMIMSLWHEFSLLAFLDGIYMGMFLAIENIFGLTTVDRRKTHTAIVVLRCVLVAAFFGVNAMFFTMDAYQLRHALGGFLRW